VQNRGVQVSHDREILDRGDDARIIATKNIRNKDFKNILIE